jgi:protein TonB
MQNAALGKRFSCFGYPIFFAALGVICPLTFGQEALPAAPAAHPGRVTISAGVAMGMLAKRIDPMCPGVVHQEGIVALKAAIDKGCHVESLRVMGGPVMLRKAALDAVKQWVYRPYILNGQPFEVKAAVYVAFSRMNGTC